MGQWRVPRGFGEWAALHFTMGRYNTCAAFRAACVLLGRRRAFYMAYAVWQCENQTTPQQTQHMNMT